jgi:hypothetical protein
MASRTRSRGSPKGLQGEALPYVVLSCDRTEWIVTNDLSSQDSTQDTQEVRGVRWKIEEFHREIEQLRGIESYRCRAGGIQRDHIDSVRAAGLEAPLKSLALSTVDVPSTESSVVCSMTIWCSSSKTPPLRWSLRKSYFGVTRAVGERERLAVPYPQSAAP